MVVDLAQCSVEIEIIEGKDETLAIRGIFILRLGKRQKKKNQK